MISTLLSAMQIKVPRAILLYWAVCIRKQFKSSRTLNHFLSTAACSMQGTAVFGVTHNFRLGSPFKPVLAFFRLAALGMQSGVEELTIIFVKHLPCVSNCSRHFYELYHLLLTTTLEGRCFCSHFYIKQFVTLRAVPTIPTQLLQPLDLKPTHMFSTIC